MLQEAADVVARGVAQQRVVPGVVENVLLVLPQALVGVHARAVVLEDGLRHHGDGLAVAHPHVLDDVLVLQHLVGHGRQGGEAHVDLRLPGGSHLVVMDLADDAAGLQRLDHLGTDVLQAVHGRHREVAFLVPGLVAQVLLVAVARVPGSLVGVDVVEAVVVALVEADVVEDVELDLRPPVAGVGDAGGLEVQLGLLRHVARVPGVGLAGQRILDVAHQVQGGQRGERIHEGGVGVREQQHVRLVDGLEAADAGAVEPDAVLEQPGVELVGGDGEMLPQPGHVGEPQVHDLRAVLLGKVDHLSRCHGVLPFKPRIFCRTLRYDSL